MDVRDNTTSSDGCLDQGIQLFITTNGELQVAGGDTLHLQVLGSISGQFQNFSGKVFQNGSCVDGSCGSDTSIGGGAAF